MEEGEEWRRDRGGGRGTEEGEGRRGGMTSKERERERREEGRMG